MVSTSPFLESGAEEFAGFEHPDASFIMCPNEFLDLALPNMSRGCVRLVGYVLHQTFKWIDDAGKPNKQEIAIPFSDLIQKAGISRGAARGSLDEAVQSKFLKLVQVGSAKSKGSAGVRTVVTLNWSDRTSVAKSLTEFDGFYAGRGNFTAVPHSYFEHLLPLEKLSVLRFVGFVFRNTIGYQTQFGRRKVVPLSYEFVQKHAGISSSDTLAQTIRHSLRSNYVKRVEQGVFGPGKQRSTASVFAPKFTSTRKVGSKSEADNLENKAEQSVQKTKREAFNYQSKMGSKTEVEQRFKKRSELKNQEIETLQTNDVDEKVQLLVDAGFERSSAAKLASNAERGVIERQMQWMKHRKYQNFLGFLRKAISEDFDEPDELVERRRRRERHEKQKRDAKELSNVQRGEQDKLKAYKNELTQKWLALDIGQREQIKSAAIQRCTPSIRSYLQKRSTDGSPALEFVNELARLKNLPTTIEFESNVLSRPKTSSTY